MIQDLEFKFLLEKIQKAKSLDFALYRSGTIKRRILSRVRATGCSGYSDYLVYLNKNNREYDLLLDALTINVTEFFRDASVFDCLEKKVIPEIIRSKERSGKKVIRVWSAGSSHGQEAYSLAMLFLEILKEKKNSFNLKIYGTDIDSTSLEIARKGAYEPAKVQKIRPAFLKKYFSFDGSHYQICDELKNLTQFDQHDLISGKPLPLMDLILCRNVLIYFTRPLQEAVCSNFAGALQDEGFLVLGKVESLLGHSLCDLQTINLYERIYRKIKRSL